jgi:hypothetical protein
MEKYIVLMHYIGSESATKEYSKGIERINQADKISKAKGHNLKFGLELSVEEANLSSELKQKIIEETRKLPGGMWFTYNPMGTGPGNGGKQILFNTAFSDKPSLISLACFDQVKINKPDSLEQINEFLYKTEKDKSLFAIGSRDVPVILATNQRNSDLRIIHELFHSLTVGKDKLKVGEKRQNITPAYAEIGESTSGFHTINNNHANYSKLAESIFRLSQTTNMGGDAFHYYTTIKAAELGRITTGYVPSLENLFHHTLNKQEEFESIVKNRIVGQTKALKQTDIREKLLSTLENEENTKRISNFYPLDDVRSVRNLMISSLK